MRYTLSICLLLLSILASAKTGHFTTSPNCVNAYKSYISFRLAEGRGHLAKEIKKDPYNRLIILLQNYEDFIQLTFKDDPSEYNKRKLLKEKRLNYLTNSDKNSPYYRLCKGIIHLQWSIIHIKYKENWKAAKDFRKAHNYFKENKKLFPSFKATDIFYGGQLTIIGSIPSSYQWISNLMGLQGNMKLGMQYVKNATKTTLPLFKDEAIFYYIFLNELVLNDSKKAMRLLSSYHVDQKNNYLFTFAASNLMLNNFKSKKVITILNSRNKSNAYLKPIIFDYSMGTAYLHNLQYTKAITYLKKYLASKSYFYKKDATLKIAYAYYLQGNISKANYYKSRIPVIGSTVTDMDKQALKSYKQGIYKNKSLIKARLLFDGGNFNTCLKILSNTQLKEKIDPKENLEWNYRLARVYDETRNLQKAILYYKKTLNAPNPTLEYYPARAALQLAFIYEKKGNKSLALAYFKKVLNMKGHQYKASLDQKAKSGIIRIKGK